LPSLPSSSSKVKIKRLGVDCHAAELKIVGRLFFNHVSPVDTLQSCMSLHSVGVIQTKFGVVAAEARSTGSWVYGTSFAAQRAVVRMSLK
jgi:hypothetical protein